MTNYHIIQSKYFLAYAELMYGNQSQSKGAVYNTETLIGLLENEKGISLAEINKFFEQTEILVEFKNAMVQIKGFQK